jgi:O-antigen ligase/polysaccharide polymerase Wzy-like membrane protein/tetratricopeptide repeat protein
LTERAISTRITKAVPLALPPLLGVGVLLVMVSLGESTSGGRSFLRNAGFTTLTWYPAALFLLGLLVVLAFVLPIRLSDVPRPVLVAAGLLAAFTAWSFLSILWSDAQGEAWDGANRTLLYLIVFCLFALWPQREGTAAVVLGVWTLAMAAFAAVVLLRLGAGASEAQAFLGRRLGDPAGYPNAAAATFFMPVWPAVLLASRSEIAWWLRGLFAGSAVLLCEVVLLTQSRGAVYTLPIVLVLLFVLVPDRARTFSALVPIAAAVALSAPRLLDVTDKLVKDRGAAADVVGPVLLVAAVVTVLWAVVALLDRRAPVTDGTRRIGRRVLGAVAIVCAAALVLGGLVAVGDPVARAKREWKSFKGGYTSTGAGESRLSMGLGSNRYDFYRVALDGFQAHPVGGIGADNFGQPYLAARRSDETPRYPHSLELRTLSQTGIVGALLLAAAFAAALVAAVGAMRRGSGRLAGATAGGATLVFLYWLVHGSFDWFWEFASLGAAAFAMLGLACALLPRRDAATAGAADESASPRLLSRTVARALVGVVALAAAISLALPWLAERDVRAAATEWPKDPRAAFDRLDRAAELNPLSDRPSLIAGSIALRIGDLNHARHAFLAALERNPRGEYAYFELGLIASELGDSAAGQRYFRRALVLNPHDALAREALDRLRRGEPLSIDEANQQILGKARQLSR